MAIAIPTVDATNYTSPSIWSKYLLGLPGPTGFSSSSTAEAVASGWSGTGKVAIITGCAAGLGLESARVLAAQGCEVVAAVRSVVKMERALVPIRAQHPAGKISVLHLDLASFSSIHAFVAEFHKMNKPLNILMLNAGIMSCPFALSADGHESQFATNHLGHFLLTKLLLPDLVATAQQPAAQEGRVVVVSSWSLAYEMARVQGHSLAAKQGDILDVRAHEVFQYQERVRLSDINSPQEYEPWKAYGQSKLCNVLFARELARRTAGQQVTVASLHPGNILATELSRFKIAPLLKTLVYLTTRPFNKSIAQGAATQVYLAVAPTIASGGYYQDCNLGPSSSAAKDDQLAQRLWELSEKMCACSVAHCHGATAASAPP